uniref:Uncharacterized protein n=1 Tax=Inoviridae sp. ct4fI15 TaxID=2825776 RepID=A0A8S5UKS6_9VIRU|nr:MAG TPA: hypothetical protein [Inoviridae sp. ct4fI15]
MCSLFDFYAVVGKISRRGLPPRLLADEIATDPPSADGGAGASSRRYPAEPVQANALILGVAVALIACR